MKKYKIAAVCAVGMSKATLNEENIRKNSDVSDA